jgi:hypothetical protein
MASMLAGHMSRLSIGASRPQVRLLCRGPHMQTHSFFCSHSRNTRVATSLQFFCGLVKLSFGAELELDSVSGSAVLALVLSFLDSTWLQFLFSSRLLGVPVP